MCSFAAGRAVRKRAAAKRERGTRLRRWAPLYQGGERRYMPIYIKCMQTTAAAQKSTYPGVAQLVARLLWERRGGIRDKARWNAAKPCDTCVCGIFLDCRKRHKSGFDHINDHRQKNLWFSSLMLSTKMYRTNCDIRQNMISYIYRGGISCCYVRQKFP